ncbi:MAG: gliding motility lipoprotein GldH [Cyclobacteriaceae bacterium]|nr:gliding motility lipoprotein GldH [Cyclobacteriaceae bacterium]
MRNSIAFVVLTALLFSCNTRQVYSEYRDVETSWDRNDPIIFSFAIDDISQPYQLVAEFRNDQEFTYYNLYFNFILSGESGDTLINELKEVILFEPKTGKPLGSGLGDVFDNVLVLTDEVRLPEAGAYQVSIQQQMRDVNLEGIHRVGFWVEAAEQ